MGGCCFDKKGRPDKMPGVIGKWIDDIVYQRIAPLILAELKKANPKNESCFKNF